MLATSPQSPSVGLQPARHTTIGFELIMDSAQAPIRGRLRSQRPSVRRTPPTRINSTFTFLTEHAPSLHSALRLVMYYSGIVAEHIGANSRGGQWVRHGYS